MKIRMSAPAMMRDNKLIACVKWQNNCPKVKSMCFRCSVERKR